jgi:hypothetical protein
MSMAASPVTSTVPMKFSSVSTPLAANPIQKKLNQLFDSKLETDQASNFLIAFEKAH